ncbi:Zn-ribbon domain-containing OB-fold protein [Pseudonocardia xinjiangensis]|uniref:Zn-ribbon domain-containing OB-fold protein n=1 Tax=Pseudonocardia xinjiangensis TaxID=75289 RepID=UPI003D949D10
MVATADTAPARPLPVPDEADTGPFWRACAEHRLTYQRRSDTGEVVFYPRGHDDPDLVTLDSAGLGTVYTFTVVRQHGHPFFRAHTPYTVAYVDLDEGFRILTEIDAEPGTVHVGQRVELHWEDHDHTSVPIFRPAG